MVLIGKMFGFNFMEYISLGKIRDLVNQVVSSGEVNQQLLMLGRVRRFVLYDRFLMAKDWFYEACFPAKCLVCRRGDRYLCSRHHVFAVAPGNKIDFRYVDEILVSVAYHDSIVKKTVEYFKFNGFKDVGCIIARDICSKLPDDFWDEVILMPIPLHWTRKLWRGFNQAEVLGEAIVKDNGIIINNDLERKRRTSQQSRLSKKSVRIT